MHFVWNFVVTQLSCLHIPHSSPYREESFSKKDKRITLARLEDLSSEYIAVF